MIRPHGLKNVDECAWRLLLARLYETEPSALARANGKRKRALNDVRAIEAIDAVCAHDAVLSKNEAAVFVDPTIADAREIAFERLKQHIDTIVAKCATLRMKVKRIVAQIGAVCIENMLKNCR